MENASLKQLNLTVRYGSGRLIDPDSNDCRSDSGNEPKLFLRDKVLLRLRFVDDEMNPVAFDSSDTFDAALDVDFKQENSLAAYSDSSRMVSERSDLPNGIVALLLNCDTDAFREKLGSAESRTAFLEVKRYPEDGLESGTILMDQVLLCNTLSRQNELPEEDAALYYNKSEILTLLSGCASYSGLEFKDDLILDPASSASSNE